MNRKRYWVITALILSFLALTACKAPNSEKAAYQKITAEQAKQMMDDGDPYVLLDVRTAGEFQDERIDGAILIPDNEIDSRAEAELTDKSVRILLYCRSGRRSALAAEKMLRLGYTNIYDFGGIIDWPYETVNG